MAKSSERIYNRLILKKIFNSSSCWFDKVLTKIFNSSTCWFDKVLTKIFAKIEVLAKLDYLNHDKQYKLKLANVKQANY